VSWKQRKVVVADLKAIYSAATVEAAKEALETFEAKWQEKFSQIARSWRSCWMNIIPLFGYPPEIRKIIRKRPLKTNGSKVELFGILKLGGSDETVEIHRDASRGDSA
jgi:transposase-like protein